MPVADMPPKRLFQMAIVVIVAGLIGAFAWFNYALSDQTNEINQFQRLPPQSGIPFEVDEAGTYTVWASAACGGRCPVPALDDLYELMVLGFEAPSGTMVRPEPYPGEQKYRISGDRHGKAAWIVEFDETGTYVLERRNLGVGSVLLLLGEGEGLDSRILSGVLGIGGVALAVAFVLAVLGRHRRNKQVDEMMERVNRIL
ncbi:MAG: hypothetical protein JJE52_14725 [Acidimicrobiia bacterium]|nr:hypothetical protein [Acidimicrobiia bacterium]